MHQLTLELWTSIVRGLTILKPYIGELNIDPVPNSFPNGAPASSHLVTIGVIMGVDEPTEEETMELKTLGWIFDVEYVTLYVPNIYVVPTMEQLKGEKAC